MKCISCGKEEFEECDVKVDGKLYGIVLKGNKKKSKIKAIVCKIVRWYFLKSRGGNYELYDYYGWNLDCYFAICEME